MTIDEAISMYEKTKSVRMTAKAYGVHHCQMSKILKANGVEVLSKSEAAKYTWKNNTHPRIGKTGESCPIYGRKMTDETREKMRPIWEANAEQRRYARKKHYNGYILVYAPSNPMADKHGFVLEHRLVMESVIGRPLKREEYVHHKNGNKTDNRPENLMLTNIREHAKIHVEMRKKYVS